MIRLMKDEWFDLVDKQGLVIGRALRSVCHGNPGLMHKAVHVFVFNSNGQMFLQRRSRHKDIQPGKWDTSVGGHLQPGEAPETGARRETREELGIDPAGLEFCYQFQWRSDVETELIHTFSVVHDGPFSLDPDEVEEGRFWNLDKIERELSTGIFTPQFTREFERIKRHVPSSD